MKIKKLLFCH